MTDRRPGMDHGLYAYSALPGRRSLMWPTGARVALRVVVYLDYWELAPPEGAIHAPDVQGPWPSIFPDYRTHSYREYGPRIGIFRLIELFDRYDLRATLAVGAAACQRYPFVVEACRNRGWELAAHGTHATRMFTSLLSEEEERVAIAQSIAAIATVAGERPTGWIGQDYGESRRTPRLVAEAGLDYLGDWPNDEQPYFMNAAGRRIVSLPAQPEWDDMELLWLRQIPTARYSTIVTDAFRRLYADGAHNARLLSLGLHPWLIGQPHRFPHLESVIAELASHEGVWIATSAEIADAFTRMHSRSRDEAGV
jgi:peptidoglycan/xylan/chitin deacetylase (PgdA/CDA1 family)